MIEPARKKAYIALAITLFVLTGIGAYFLLTLKPSSKGASLRRMREARNALYAAKPEEAKLTADESADLLDSLWRKYDSEIPKLPPYVAARRPVELAGKYLAEGQYEKALGAYRKGVLIFGPDDNPDNYMKPDRDGFVLAEAYLAGLASKDDMLDLNLKRKWNKTIGPIKLFIRMNYHWARKEYRKVAELGQKPQPTTKPTATAHSTTNPAAPSDRVRKIRPWLAFLRAKALYQLGKKKEAYDILANDYLARIPTAIQPAGWMTLHADVFSAIVAKETEHEDMAREITKVILSGGAIKTAPWAQQKAKLSVIAESLKVEEPTTLPSDKTAPR